jgi:ATP-dependent RNA helicase DDX23/PRP28
MAEAHERFVTGKAEEEQRREARLKKEREEKMREQRQKMENKKAEEFDHEVKAIRDHYLGIKEAKRRIIKPSEKFSKLFQFDWEADDDTTKNDMNPLYNNRMKINPMFGRGYIGGVDLREQRKDSNFLSALTSKRILEAKKLEEADNSLTAAEKAQRAKAREMAADAWRRQQQENLRALDNKVTGMGESGSHWSEKSLEEMTDRDWRIFKEDFDIRIQVPLISIFKKYTLIYK